MRIPTPRAGVAADQTLIRTRILRFLVVLGSLTLAGTAGYVVLEGWSVLDAVYMTVITLSTVGFREIAPMSPAGQVFTIGLIMAGVGSALYLLSSIGEYVVSGELRGFLRTRRMEKNIARLRDHYIICGYGRVGRQVVEDLIERGKRCVIIEPDPDVVEAIPEDRLHVPGDASDDAVLRHAGIEHARGLVAATGDDATNVFITLTARRVRADLIIVTRVTKSAAEPKAVSAGANHVISPYTITGRRIATQLLYPSITDSLDVVVQSHGVELGMEEVRIQSESELEGQTMGEAQVRSRTGANILAIWRPGEHLPLTSPPLDYRFRAGDRLVVLGTPGQLSALAALAGDHG